MKDSAPAQEHPAVSGKWLPHGDAGEGSGRCFPRDHLAGSLKVASRLLVSKARGEERWQAVGGRERGGDISARR